MYVLGEDTPETLVCSTGQMAEPSTPTGTQTEDHVREMPGLGYRELVWTSLL